MMAVGDCKPMNADELIVVAWHWELTTGVGFTVVVWSCVLVMAGRLIVMGFGLATAIELIVTSDGFTAVVCGCGLVTIIELFVLVWNCTFTTEGSAGEF
jgi:hypothetical protein